MLWQIELGLRPKLRVKSVPAGYALTPAEGIFSKRCLLEREPPAGAEKGRLGEHPLYSWKTGFLAAGNNKLEHSWNTASTQTMTITKTPQSLKSQLPWKRGAQEVNSIVYSYRGEPFRDSWW